MSSQTVNLPSRKHYNHHNLPQKGQMQMCAAVVMVGPRNKTVVAVHDGRIIARVRMCVDAHEPGSQEAQHEQRKCTNTHQKNNKPTKIKNNNSTGNKSNTSSFFELTEPPTKATSHINNNTRANQRFFIYRMHTSWFTPLPRRRQRRS